MSYYSKTLVFADGGNFKHMQQGEVWHGLVAKDAAPTGITWQWVQHHDGRQEKLWRYGDVIYTTFAAARAAYETPREDTP